ncbi:SWIM zinc finger family protein [Acaryochloris sp. IP29b_bin.148]|uniref:SWIM zinc finger family protein n=1 Tax=Acaryochloris sp. IP29b_bin.148 TaxID=2969218 RepID=UPI0026107B01|nr:SWIM zinc finger family protein [Acaryochloris sp. IP29b_bin.148]
MKWTVEQVIALSPDDKSTKNGKSLANASKWPTLGTNEQAIWGECRGSGKKPYRTQIDLSEPAFLCSCPSRKFPCKHSLALFLLFANQADLFTPTDPPDWVQEWLEKRSQTASRKQTKAKATADPEAQAKRMAQREAKISAGLADLDQWLRDLMRQGLATAQTQPYRFWENAAARMVDAQAPGLARRLRDMAGIPHTGGNWPSRLLAELGKLYLLVQGYQRLAILPEAVQAEVRSQMGWTQKQEELLTNPSSLVLEDTWSVLGKHITTEDNLNVQCVWLWGCTHQRPALILSFGYQNQPLDTSLMPGTAVPATLVFYPGLYPLRALVKERQPSVDLPPPTLSAATLSAAMTHYGEAIATNPWLNHCPLLLAAVIPQLSDQGWRVIDPQGDQLPLRPGFDAWPLLALSGGHPVMLFGEWDGQTLLPLSLWANNRFMPC